MLSTASSSLWRLVISAIAAMSVRVRIGFAGDSMNTMRVCGRDRCFHVRRIGSIDEGGVYSERLQNLAKESDGSTVGHLGKNGVLACLQHGEKQRAFCGHAAAEADCRGGSFQRADGAFQRIYRWVRDARVAESLIYSNGIVNECAGLVEREKQRAGMRVQRAATVNGQRLQCLDT